MKHYGPHDLDEFLEDEDLVTCDVCDERGHEDDMHWNEQYDMYYHEGCAV